MESIFGSVNSSRHYVGPTAGSEQCRCKLPCVNRLLITGSLAYDYILDYPGLLQDSLGVLHHQESSNIQFHSQKLARFFGGCGGNVAYTLALLGERPRLLAIAGGEADEYLRHLSRLEVDCSAVEVVPEGRTATCFILNDEAQNRIVAFHGGVVDQAARLDLASALDPSIVGCIITPDDVPAMVKFAQQCREADLPFYFDFGSQVTWLSADQLRQSLRGARAAFCNEYEFSVFQEKTGWDLEQTLACVPVMVVTQGSEGCLLHRAGQPTQHVPPCPLRSETVDPSGAGDAFRAGFGYARVRDWPWLASTQLASTTAAFALEGLGTQGHRFSKEELLERCQQVYGPLPQELL